MVLRLDTIASVQAAEHCSVKIRQSFGHDSKATRALQRAALEANGHPPSLGFAIPIAAGLGPRFYLLPADPEFETTAWLGT